MSEITVETGELAVCVNCQFKHAVGLLHHVDPSLEKEKYGKTIELINEIGEGLMMTSQEVEDFIRAYELEHKVEDVLTVLRDLRHKIMEGSEKRFEALEAGENPGNPRARGSDVYVRAGTLVSPLDLPWSAKIKCPKCGHIDLLSEFALNAELLCPSCGKRIPFTVKVEVVEDVPLYWKPGSDGNPAEIPERCEFTKHPVKPKEYFDPASFRTLCPECPEGRCANCPPELACATRIIIGCKEGEFVKGRCRIGTEAHTIYHGKP